MKKTRALRWNRAGTTNITGGTSVHAHVHVEPGDYALFLGKTSLHSFIGCELCHGLASKDACGISDRYRRWETWMGQAKWRKENDGLFGKVPKDARRRGLIVSPPMEINGSSLRLGSSDLDPQELRFSLLFWDRLMWPASRTIYISGGPDSKFLEAEGILTRPEYTFYGDGAAGIKAGFMAALRDTNEKEPGAWSLSCGERSLKIAGADFSESGGALVTLVRAIPVPQRDVPLEEVIRFREYRTDELMLLRHHLDSMIARISAAEDQDSEADRCRIEIETACADLLRVGREWRMPFKVADFHASFSMDTVRMMEGAAAGATLGQLFGAGAVLSALGGAAVSTIKIEPAQKFRSIRAPKSPYMYGYLAHKELI